MSGLSRFAFVMLVLAAMLVSRASADEVYHAYPFQYTYATGRIDYHMVQQTYDKHSAEMKCGRDGQHLLNPWMKLDLSGVPPGAVIDEAYLYYYVKMIQGTRPQNYVTLVANDPVPASAEVIYNDVKNGMIVGNDVPHGGGQWVERLLDSRGRQAITDAIEQGWIAFGFYAFNNPTGRMNMPGYNEGGSQPYLKFKYHIPPPYEPDLAVTAINSPSGELNVGATVTPEVVVRNYGTEDFPYSVTLMIVNPWTDIIYLDTVQRDGLAPGDKEFVTFQDLTLPEPTGNWTAIARVRSQDDIKPENDEAVDWFRVIPPYQPPAPPVYGWEEIRPAPLAPSHRFVGRGGWLAANRNSGLIYGAKGDRTADFYSYNPGTDRWTRLTGIPWQEHPLWYRRPPQDGGRGVSDNDNYIYALQGGKTLGFWRYDIAGDKWEVLPDVPQGPTRRRVIGGTDMTYVSIDGDSYIYLLKGRTGEFCRYSVAEREWQELPTAPPGVNERWNRGSWLVSDGLGTIYAHKARYAQNTPEPHHELWLFDVRAGVWEYVARNGMPLIGWHANRMRGRKSGDGSGAGWFDGAIWALKGGNSQQYYRYDPCRNRWHEEEPIGSLGSANRRRMVKNGGHFVAYPRGRAFYALKGNKTVEFWRYRLPPEGWVPGGGQGARGPLDAGSFTVRPSLVVKGHTTIQYAVPRAGQATVTVVDVVGRTVLSRKLTAARTGSAGLDLRSLVAGVYLVRFEADGFDATRKLVVQK